jgi:hypothetical protein
MKKLFIFAAMVLFTSCAEERFVFISDKGTKEVAFYDSYEHPLQVGDTTTVIYDSRYEVVANDYTRGIKPVIKKRVVVQKIIAGKE